ncbi:MAG: MerR family transcriptional regulator [Acidobacteriota bacterium]|nr:MerR family transcriptional regulator [Acidobacteriota bacterium]
MRIGELALKCEVSIKTIRYYEEIGVLAGPERTPSGYRNYEPEAVDRLRFIRASQSVGLTLREIREIVAYRDRGDVPCAHVLELLRRHREDCVGQIAELHGAVRTLDSLITRAARFLPEDCSPDGVCHLIPRTAERV